MMTDVRSTREALEQSWKMRLDDARQGVNFARNFVREVETAVGSGRVPSVNERSAYVDALEGERRAVENYERVLRIFSNLVVNGQVPDEKRA